MDYVDLLKSRKTLLSNKLHKLHTLYFLDGFVYLMDNWKSTSYHTSPTSSTRSMRNLLSLLLMTKINWTLASYLIAYCPDILSPKYTSCITSLSGSTIHPNSHVISFINELFYWLIISHQYLIYVLVFLIAICFTLSKTNFIDLLYPLKFFHID